MSPTPQQYQRTAVMLEQRQRPPAVVARAVTPIGDSFFPPNSSHISPTYPLPSSRRIYHSSEMPSNVTMGREHNGLCPNCGFQVYNTKMNGGIGSKLARRLSGGGKGKQPDHCGRCIRCSDLDYGSPLGVACDPPASLGPTPPVSVAAVARGAIPSNIPSAISFPVSSSKRGKAKAKAAGYFGHSKDAPPTGGICKYSGSYNEVGQRHGTGTLLWENGDQYEGKFWNGHLDGEGALYFADGSNYEGNFCLSKMDGTGTRRFSNGNVYTGEYCEGRRAGQGRCYFSNGDIYHGGWKADLIHGFGRYYYATGRAYEGNFLSGQRVGRGKLQLVDGSVDIYRYVKDKRVGDGVRWSQDRKNAWRLDENGEKKEAVSIAEAMHLANQCGLAVKV